ncbi:MAG: hypothetical protein ACJ8AW_39305 [Rhodopila sp.]
MAVGFILLSVLPGCAADDAGARAILFPDAQGPLKPDGDARRVSLGGTDTIEIQPLRFTPLPGHSVALNTTWCGVVLRDPSGVAQGVVTIGTGITDVLSCGHLLEAGALPPAGGVARLGLVYRTASPNASVVTPVVLARPGPGAPWAVDADLSQRLTLLPGTASLARIRQALRRP